MNEPRPRTEADLIELVRSSDVEAPEALHRRVQSLIAERSSPRARRSGLGPLGARLAGRLSAAAGLVAAAAAVLAVTLVGSDDRSLSLHEATALTLSAATAPAPRESPRNHAELVAAVQGVHFPYWEEHFGWRSTGQRTDHVAGRTVMTVFYSNRSGRRIGYAIVAGSPAPWLGGGTITLRGGHSYRLHTTQGTAVVTWLRGGRLCVLSGRGVDAPTLLRLASWDRHGSVA
jgi:hypothetical protein